MSTSRLADPPHLRNIRSPLQPEALQPLADPCGVLQVQGLTEHEWHTLANSEATRSGDFILRISGTGMSQDLWMLKLFPRLSGFELNDPAVENLEPLSHLPSSLQHLSLAGTRKRANLGVIRRFENLQSLYLSEQHNGLEALGELTELRRLQLSSITVQNLDFLLPLRRLEELSILLGGTRDLSVLPKLGRLKLLRIVRVRGLSNLQSLAGLTDLEELYLEDLPQVEELPSFSRLSKLRFLQVSLKKLKDLSAIASARSLEEALLLKMECIDPDEFGILAGHPTLKRATVWLGNLKKSRAAQAKTGLPTVYPTSP